MKPGRPREFDEAAALEAAMALFWEKGFEATSKRELMDATGLASQSLYNAFGDKHDLYLAAVEHYAEMRFAMLAEMMNAPGSPLENVRSFVRMWGEVARDGSMANGCMLCNSSAEFGSSDDAVCARLKEFGERMHALLGGALERARDAGELPDGARPESMATLLVATSNGVALMLRSGAPPERVDEVAAAVLETLLS